MLARLLAGLCISIAALVLLGWAFGLPQLVTFGRPWTPMVATTSFSVVFGAAAILAIVGAREALRWRIVWFLGAPVGAIAAVTLADISSAWARGIPLFVTTEPWLMPLSTAIATLFLGGALVLLGRSRRKNVGAEVLLVLALLIALATLLALLFGAAPRSVFTGHVNMSPITGLCLAVLTATLLSLVPDGVFARVVGGSGPGSRIARPLFALVIIAPVLLGWFRLDAEERGMFALEYGVAVMVLGTAIISTFAIFVYALRVNRYDAQRRRELEAQMFLGRASVLLAASLDLKATLAAVADLCVPALADLCSVTLRTADGTLESVAVSHRDPAKVALVREFQRLSPPDPKARTGVATVARTGTAEFHEDISEAVLASAANDPEQLRILRALEMRSLMLVPLIAGSRTVGVLSLVTAESARKLTPDDLRTAQLLADRCATAIDRARLFGDLQRELALRDAAETSLRALAADLEQRVAQRTAELAVTNRELESFAYSVSHDLRTPLRALDGFSQALLEDYGEKLDDVGKDYLDRIRRGSQRMGDLIDALLDLSRVSRGELQHERVDLSAIATDILDLLRARAPERQVRASVGPDLAATGDPRLLRALLQNLLANAWKFTANRPDARIEFTSEANNGHPVFVVRDNGAGFDMAYVSKLFGAFQRLHNSKEFEGTGVGLATAQRIVHRHAGEIWAKGVPQQGAAFYFTLG